MLPPGADGSHGTRKWAQPGSAAAGGMPVTGMAGAAAAKPARPARGLGAPPGGDRGRGLGEGFGETERTDNWWLSLLAQGAWAARAPRRLRHLGGVPGHPLRVRQLPFAVLLAALKPSWWPLAGAPGPGSAARLPRHLDYYYRKAHYRAFFADPIACAVGEPATAVSGEAGFPFALQNIHRYFIYLAIPILLFLWVGLIARALVLHRRRWLPLPGIGVRHPRHAAREQPAAHHVHVLLPLTAAPRGGQLDCFSCAVAGGPRHQAWQPVEVPSTGTTWARRGGSLFSCPRRRTSTCACARWGVIQRREAPGEHGRRRNATNTTCWWIGAGGVGLRAAIEASAAGCVGVGLVVQVAARQGAHRDGGRRRGRGARAKW